jgi:hypothetical protein
LGLEFTFLVSLVKIGKQINKLQTIDYKIFIHFSFMKIIDKISENVCVNISDGTESIGKGVFIFLPTTHQQQTATRASIKKNVCCAVHEVMPNCSGHKQYVPNKIRPYLNRDNTVASTAAAMSLL